MMIDDGHAKMELEAVIHNVIAVAESKRTSHRRSH
jgi:hypothetical protein